MAVEEMLRGEPTRCIPWTEYILGCILGCNFNLKNVMLGHVRSNYIFTQLVNYGNEIYGLNDYTCYCTFQVECQPLYIAFCLNIQDCN